MALALCLSLSYLRPLVRNIKAFYRGSLLTHFRSHPRSVMPSLSSVYRDLYWADLEIQPLPSCEAMALEEQLDEFCDSHQQGCCEPRRVREDGGPSYKGSYYK